MKALLMAGAMLLVAATAAQAADHQITIVNMKYSPARVSAKIGDTLTFVNKDTVTHEVYSSTPGFGINLGDIKTGETTVMTLRQKGRFDVECGIHPNMPLRVSVK
jgi:plastocyanin